MFFATYNTISLSAPLGTNLETGPDAPSYPSRISVMPWAMNHWKYFPQVAGTPWQYDQGEIVGHTLPQHGQRLARLRDRVTFTVHSTADILTLLDSVTRSMTERGFLDRDAFAMRLALEEAVVNGIKHGNHYDPAKVVQVRCRMLNDQILVEVEDEGSGFDPEQVADPLAPANLERPCGRGLLLMRHYMTWVKYDSRGNHVTLCKHKSSQ